MKYIEIKNDLCSLLVNPQIGGSLFRLIFRSSKGEIDIFRSVSPEVSRSSDFGSFLMLPYPNRIRDGKFNFSGTDYTLKFPEKHSIHGDVRDRPWEVISATASECVLEFISNPQVNFPFQFTAQQRYKIEGTSVFATISTKNVGGSVMPFGYGHHPYFPRQMGATPEMPIIRFSCGGTYPFEGEIPLPTGPMKEIPQNLDFSKGIPLPLSLDHCFGKWNGIAEIEWPKSKIKLTTKGDKNLSHLVIYSPPDKPFFALEPQTQAIDGFNLLANGVSDTGVITLQPGETHTSTVTWSIEEL